MMGTLRQRKANWLAKKQKPAEPSLLDQLSGPLKDFVNDFKEHGKAVLEKVREENPAKYLEMASKLAALVVTLKPPQDGFHDANTMEEIGLRLLKSIGMEEEDITPEMITEAIACNDAFIAKLQAIRDDAIMAAAVQGEGELN